MGGTRALSALAHGRMSAEQDDNASDSRCSRSAEAATKRLADHLRTEFSSLLNVTFMPDCDSGGSYYVRFFLSSVAEAEAQMTANPACRDSDDPTTGEAILFTCDFKDVSASVQLSSAPRAEGEAEVLRPTR